MGGTARGGLECGSALSESSSRRQVAGFEGGDGRRHSKSSDLTKRAFRCDV